MSESIVKFVNSGSHFVEVEGSVVNLYTVSSTASSATVETVAVASLDEGDYIIIPTPTTTYYVWMDISGSPTTDDPEVADCTGIRVNISSQTTAAEVATVLAAAVTAVSGLTAVVNSGGDVEIDVDTAGECDAISDFSCGFTLTDVWSGYAANTLVKSGTPNSDPRVVEVKDVTYSSTTDSLVALSKVKTTTEITEDHPETGYTIVYSYETITDSDWALG